MDHVTKYPHGCFNWVDLSSTDAAAATTFYCALFGWEAVDNPLPDGGVYTMLQLNGYDVAGLSQLSDEMMAGGMPTVWNSYINVDDINEATAKAEAAGATVIAPPFDVMDSGKMSVLQDPTGAFVSLWQAGTHIGATLCNMANTHTWNELASPDPQKSIAFYSEALGWQCEDAEGMEYWMFKNAERNGSGMIRLTEEMGAPPNWMVYFGVEDMDAAAAKITELGGSLIVPPFEAGETGRIAVAADPTGGVFSIIQANFYDPMP